MEVLERSVKEAVHRVDAEPSTGDAAWFAARQPGIVRYLETRCGRDDSMGVALLAALAVHGAFERALGVAPPRVLSSALERAEATVVSETRAGQPGFVVRQKALAGFVAGVVAAPPVPLGEEESTRLALVLAAVVHALDEASRPG
jgi:hypothetical protein